MKSFLNALANNPAVCALLDKTDGLSFQSLSEEATVISAAYIKQPQNFVIIKNNLYNAQRLYNKIANLVQEENCALFAVEESLRVEAIASSPEITAKKIETMACLLENHPRILITHAAAVIRMLPSVETFSSRSITLQIDQCISIKQLRETLVKAGYQAVNRVDQPLCFAIRGGIVDIYSMNENDPIRIEFFDDQIESIRFFNISTQRTIRTIDKITIIPATDILFDEKDIEEIQTKCTDKLEKAKLTCTPEEFNTLQSQVEQDLEMLRYQIKENRHYLYYSYIHDAATILDYIKNPLIIESTHDSITQQLHHLLEETIEYLQELISEKQILSNFQVFHDYHDCIKKRNILQIEELDSFASVAESLIRSVDVGQQSLSVLLPMIKKQAEDKKVLCCILESEAKEFLEACINYDIHYHLLSDEEEELHDFNVLFKEFDEGIDCEAEGMILYSSKELFNKNIRIGRYANKFKEAEILNSYEDLERGDYVVHSQHGVGQYIGIETKIINNIHKDFLHIVYKGEDSLFVPLEQFRLVRKFISREGVVPKLNKLGSNEWNKTKAKIKESVDNIAERLIELYSQREKCIGFAFKEDSEDQIEFEKQFDYELTPDQSVAIEEIKKDMMSNKPMDRLLCGDVGFGKTEVAIRAAFKAVENGKQVAYLCPTTILSSQHYKTFRERFKNYAVNIKVLNRFVPPASVKEILKDTKDGKVDILIGTHRLLSKDVQFKDLGFLIIDEEQRFGVEHKEKIKEMKESIDVLSLSATPIPRTLQMSLIGIRQLSQLETPPSNRLPVQTYVLEKNKGVIKEVIQRELARGGQVFYLFNNTLEIYNVARQIQKALPEAKVAVAHGKMSRDEIEEVMQSFVQNEINVLICTTIIETGIDIPNANTILIESADTFGLSQLYQIKGRVGRSDRLAYAYLMVKSKKQLSEVAEKRLQAIKEFTQLGSGYKIAMRDLTIRGAGDLLGAEQSGFIDTVGIDMYIEMLKEAIDEKKGIIKPEKEIIAPAPLPIDGYIPQEFAPQDLEKITLYQRIDQIKSKTALLELKEEIVDLYGKLPKSVNLLFEKKQLEILMNEKRIEKFREIKGALEITFTSEWSSNVDGVALFECFTTISKDISLKYIQGRIIATVPKINDRLFIAIEMLERSKFLNKEVSND